jgi:pullulanase/glycogen debranching enzyme
MQSDALVFFGATGDLAHKKIFPALHAMAKRGRLDVPVIGVAKAGWNLDHHHIMLNAYWEPLEFELPPVGDGGPRPWRRWIDTSLDSPHDIVEWEQAPAVPGHTYPVGPRSVVVLVSGL